MVEPIDAHFDKEFYLAQNPDVAAAGVDPLDHYKKYGWREGRWPAPWFDPGEYRLRFPELVDWEVDPFAHLVANGDVEGVRHAYEMGGRVMQSADPKELIVGRTRLATETDGYALVTPSQEDINATEPFFDGEYYLSTRPDIARTLVDPLLDFLTIGWLEGRDPSPDFSLGYYLRENPDVAKAQINPFVHYCRYGRNEPWRRAVGPAEAAVLDLFDNDARMREMVREALALDPMVALPTEKRTIGIPPRVNKALAAASRSLRLAMAGRTYNFVVLMPHIRMSGASRVSAAFARTLAAIVAGEDILLVCTDSSEAEFRHWFPDNCALFDGSAIFNTVEPGWRIRLLYDLLRGVGAKAFFNINSRLAWDAMEFYSGQLSQEFRVFTYLFTWDETVNGTRVGYPIQWLRQTCDHHHVIFTDNAMLADEIRTRFGFDDERCAVIALHTPVETSETVATLPAGRGRRPVFLWAGRFDRQKRTDLLVAIAQACPQVQFYVYGKPVLEKIDFTADKLPDNCTLKGTYTDLADVFEKDVYSGFLYTAQWDGIPTILLDMGAAGLPIVASDVGGISELVTKETGWLISPFDDIDAYVSAIKQIADDPAEAAGRAEAMRRHLDAHFSEADYREAIRKALARHGL